MADVLFTFDYTGPAPADFARKVRAEFDRVFDEAGQTPTGSAAAQATQELAKVTQAATVTGQILSSTQAELSQNLQGQAQAAQASATATGQLAQAQNDLQQQSAALDLSNRELLEILRTEAQVARELAQSLKPVELELEALSDSAHDLQGQFSDLHLRQTEVTDGGKGFLGTINLIGNLAGSISNVITLNRALGEAQESLQQRGAGLSKLLGALFRNGAAEAEQFRKDVLGASDATERLARGRLTRESFTSAVTGLASFAGSIKDATDGMIAFVEEGRSLEALLDTAGRRAVSFGDTIKAKFNEVRAQRQAADIAPANTPSAPAVDPLLGDFGAQLRAEIEAQRTAAKETGAVLRNEFQSATVSVKSLDDELSRAQKDLAGLGTAARAGFTAVRTETSLVGEGQKGLLERISEANEGVKASARAIESAEAAKRQSFLKTARTALEANQITGEAFKDFLRSEEGTFSTEKFLNSLAGSAEKLQGPIGAAITRVNALRAASGAFFKSFREGAEASEQPARGLVGSLGRIVDQFEGIGSRAGSALTRGLRAALGETRFAELQSSLAGVGEELGVFASRATSAATILGGLALAVGAVIAVVVALAGALLIATPLMIGLGLAGLKVNSQLEQTNIGIASVIASVGTLKTADGVQLKGIDALNAALPLARQQLDALRVDALNTALTFEEIAPAFLEAIGPGLAAGLNLNQIRKTVIDLSQLIIPLTGNANQLGQELRAIFSGDITNDAQVAKTLGLTKELIEKAKEQGKLAELLNEKLAVAAATGKLMAGTFAAATSNLREAGALIAGAVTEGLFTRLRDQVNRILPQIFSTAAGKVTVNAEFKGLVDTLTLTFNAIGDVLSKALQIGFDELKKLSAFLENNKSGVIELIEAVEAVGLAFINLSATISDTLGLGTINAVIFLRDNLREVALIIAFVQDVAELALASAHALIAGLTLLIETGLQAALSVVGIQFKSLDDDITRLSNKMAVLGQRLTLGLVNSQTLSQQFQFQHLEDVDQPRRSPLSTDTNGALQSALAKLTAPTLASTGGGGRARRAVSETSEIERLSNAYKKLLLDVTALEHGGGPLFDLQIRKEELEQTKRQLEEILKLRRELNLSETAPLPNTREGREAQLRDLKRQVDERESIIKLGEREKDLLHEIRLERAKLNAAPASPALTAELTLLQQANERKEHGNQLIADEIVERERLRRILSSTQQSQEREAARQQTFNDLNRERNNGLQDEQALRGELDALLSSQGAALLEQTATQAAENNLLRGKVALLREIAALVAESQAGQPPQADVNKRANAQNAVDVGKSISTLNAEIDVSQRRLAALTGGDIKEAQVAQLQANADLSKSAFETQQQLFALREQDRLSFTESVQFKRDASNAAELSFRKGAQDTARELAALREQDRVGFEETESFKQDLRNRFELEARQAARSLREENAKLELEIGQGFSLKPDEARHAQLDAIAEVGRKDKEASESMIRNRVELADATIFHAERSNAIVLDTLAKQTKGVSEIFGDAKASIITSAFDAIDNAVGKLSARFGILKGFIQEIVGGLLKLVASRILQGLLGLNSPGTGGGNFFSRGAVNTSGGAGGGGGFNLNGLLSFLNNQGGASQPNGGGGGFGGFGGLSNTTVLSNTTPAPSGFGGLNLGNFGITVPGNLSGLPGGGALTGAGGAGGGGLLNLFSGAQGAALLKSIGPALPFLGAGLGNQVGGTLGGIGGLVLGGAGFAAIGGAGAFSGILTGLGVGAGSAAGISAAAVALLTNPFTIAAGIGLLVGGILLKRSKQRHTDEETSGVWLQDAIDAIADLKKQAIQGNILDEKTARNIFSTQILEPFKERIGTLKTASVRESRLTNQVADLQKLFETTVLPAVEDSRGRNKIFNKLQTGNFHIGGLAMNETLAVVLKDEMVLTNRQQRDVMALAGYNVFRTVGVPSSVEAERGGLPLAHSGGTLGGIAVDRTNALIELITNPINRLPISFNPRRDMNIPGLGEARLVNTSNLGSGGATIANGTPTVTVSLKEMHLSVGPGAATQITRLSYSSSEGQRDLADAVTNLKERNEI